MSGAEGPARRGEELDARAVDAWLKPRAPGLEGDPVVTQYSGGVSNWTYRLRYANRDLVLRRPPAGTKAAGAHDMTREHRVQLALKPRFPLVPRMVALCEDASVIGAPFYVMERVDGIIPRKTLGADASSETARRLCHRAIDTLAELHEVDADKAGLLDLGKGPGYPARQIEGWTRRYQNARTWNVPTFAGVARWLRDHTPHDADACIIHNDYRLDNLVLDARDASRIVGVLDWEMATIGDPYMDVGNSLAYWVQADDDALARRTRRQPTHLPGMLTRAEVVQRYEARRGAPPAPWEYYEAYGVFRLAVIAQQIYYRYHHGQTKNPAFRHFWILVNYLHWRCRRIIRRAETRT